MRLLSHPAGSDSVIPVWEIGPGLGSLTTLLLDGYFDLTLFELDYGIIEYLSEVFGKRVSIRAGDAVATLTEAAGEEIRAEAIVGNLPYRSAGAIIARIVELRFSPRIMVFMVQAELADRLRAVPGSSDYSALTVLVQSHFDVIHRFNVGSSAFYPRPSVGSSVVTLNPRSVQPDPSSARRASSIARLLFSQRRKTCSSVLRNYDKHHPEEKGSNGSGADRIPTESIRAAAFHLSLDLRRRAETFSVEEYLTWGDWVEKNRPG